MTILETIQARHSVRSFTGKLPSESFMREVGNSVDAAHGDGWRIALVKSAIDGNIGSYGIIKNAPAWFVLISDNTPVHTLYAAEALEKIVLSCVAAGLGTVWISGTFSASKIADFVHLNADEKIRAVVPFGIPAQKQSWLDKVMKRMAGSATRKSFDKLFIAHNDAFGPYREALEAMRLAPSALNAQPWRAVVDNNRVTFTVVTNNANTMLDMGIALCHFKLVAEEKQIPGTMTIDISLPTVAVWH